MVSPCSSDTGAESAAWMTVGAATAAPGVTRAAVASNMATVARWWVRNAEVERTSTPSTACAAGMSPPCDGSVNGVEVPSAHMVSAKLTCPSPRSTFLSSLPEALRGSLPSQRSM